jgi:ABC-2 type transport system ATP-binding protein
MNTTILAAQDLKKSFGDHHAVSGVSFEITRGEVFGLLGPNGAGKTTTISMLTGLLNPTAGQALVDGQQLSQKANGLKSKIGFVPQELALYPTLSAYDNLIFFGRIYGLIGKVLKERVEYVLAVVGLADRAKDRIDSYSGGMKRRINIAAGLLHEPEILFLDEPTVGVDPQSRNAIFEAVEALNKEGLTIIYTTHYMEEAERLCNRIAIMDHGKVIALDTPKALMEGLGGGLLRVGLHNGKLPLVHEQVEKLGAVMEVSQLNEELMVKTHHAREALLGVLDVTNQLDARVTSLEILEPNLEAVFLELTGRTLRN